MREVHLYGKVRRRAERRSSAAHARNAIRAGLLAVCFAACVGAGDDEPDARGPECETDIAGSIDLADVTASDAEADGASRGSELRSALGVPQDAARVLVFGQTAHLSRDPLGTREPETSIVVADIFSRALDALEADPEYRYAIGEMEWLRRYWESHPERHESIRRFNSEGRLAIVGGAVSSPDVLLPLGDNLLRDYRTGAKWLRSVGLVRTSSAWLPDSEGLGPTTPDVLSAVGFEAVAFWHVDGASEAPKLPASVADFACMAHAPSSSADILASAQAIDFLWEGVGGTKIFAHWLSHGYMIGDHLDYERIDRREVGQPAGLAANDAGILANIQAIADLVLPISPTDYGFIPVGGDFQYPKKDLARWMRAWNAERYPSTGIWAVAATFDDYAKLAMTQADRLAVRSMDLSPYRMGSFATREQLKHDARLASATLSQAEAVAAVAGVDLDREEFDRLAWLVSQTNHHDWVSGSAARSVFGSEPGEATRVLRSEVAALRDNLMVEFAQRAGRDQILLVNTDHHRRNARFALPWDESDGVVGMTALGDGFTQNSSGYVEGGVLRGSAWLEPLSASTLNVYTWVADRTPMTVRCMTDEREVACVDADRVEVDQGPYSTLIFDRRSGGTLLTLDGTPDGSNLLTGPAFRLYDYVDEGGPATFGHELEEPVCGFTAAGEIIPAGPVAVEVRANSQATTVAFAWEHRGMTWRRKYRVGKAQLDPLDVELTVGVAVGHAIVARFDTRIKGDMWMAVPGGVVKRPVEKRFSPTFWSFERWAAKIEPDVATFGIIAPSNPAVSFGEDGRIELVLAREPGNACGEPEGALRPVTLSMRVVSTYAHEVNGGVATTMDEFAQDLYEPLLAVRGVGLPGDIGPGWITSISTTNSDAGDFDWRIRVARFAKTAEGYVLTLEKRMLAPRRLQVEVATRFPLGTVVERLDATEGLIEVVPGARADRLIVAMETNYLTLRFRLPPASHSD